MMRPENTAMAGWGWGGGGGGGALKRSGGERALNLKN